jgi:hypothetical protein
MGKLKVIIPHHDAAERIDLERKLGREFLSLGLVTSIRNCAVKTDPCLPSSTATFIMGTKAQLDKVCRDMWCRWGSELEQLHIMDGFCLDKFSKRSPRVLTRMETAYLSKGPMGHHTRDHAMFVGSLPLRLLEKKWKRGEAHSEFFGEGEHLQGGDLKESQVLLNKQLGLAMERMFKLKGLVRYDYVRKTLSAHYGDKGITENEIHVLIVGYDDFQPVLPRDEIDRVNNVLDELCSTEASSSSSSSSAVSPNSVAQPFLEPSMISPAKAKELKRLQAVDNIKVKCNLEAGCFEVSAIHQRNTPDATRAVNPSPQYAIDLPGGKRELGEILLLCSLREIYEETGCLVKLCNIKMHQDTLPDHWSQTELKRYFDTCANKGPLSEYGRMILEGNEAVTELEYIGGTFCQLFLIRDEPRSGCGGGAEKEDLAVAASFSGGGAAAVAASGGGGRGYGEIEWKATAIDPTDPNMKPEIPSMTKINRERRIKAEEESRVSVIGNGCKYDVVSDISSLSSGGVNLCPLPIVKVKWCKFPDSCYNPKCWALHTPNREVCELSDKCRNASCVKNHPVPKCFNRRKCTKSGCKYSHPPPKHPSNNVK